VYPETPTTGVVGADTPVTWLAKAAADPPAAVKAAVNALIICVSVSDVIADVAAAVDVPGAKVIW